MRADSRSRSASGQRHETGHFGPCQRAIDSPPRKYLCERGAIERHLGEVKLRHVFEALRCRPVGLEVQNQQTVAFHSQTVQTPAHARIRTEFRQIRDDGDFRARLSGEHGSEVGMLKDAIVSSIDA